MIPGLSSQLGADLSGQPGRGSGPTVPDAAMGFPSHLGR